MDTTDFMLILSPKEMKDWAFTSLLHSPVRTLERSQGFLRGTYETKESAYSRLDLYTTSGLLPRAHNTKYVNLMCRIHERNRDNLNNSIFSQVAEPHVPKCFPGANNCDVCAKTLHARDVISKSMWKKDQISTKHWKKTKHPC